MKTPFRHGVGKKRLWLIGLLGCWLLAGNVQAGISLSSYGQKLDVMADTDPMAPKPGGQRWVTGSPATNDLGEPGKFYQIAIKPGGGGYPGATLSFDQPVDFSRHEVLALWFKSDAPVSYFEIVLNGADGVIEDRSLTKIAATPGTVVRPGVWHQAFIPYKAEPGWVRNGARMDYSKIKSVTFYTSDTTLSPKRAAYRFEVGGLTLCGMAEAKGNFADKIARRKITTALRLAATDAMRLWTADAGEKIFADTPFPESAPRAKAACVTAAGHEYASLLWVVRPARDLTGVAVETSDLVGRKMHLAATNIVVRYVDSIVQSLGAYPDPLPLLNGKNLHAKKDRNLLVWATVYVPAGTAKGTYRGDFVLKDSVGLNQPLPIELEVYGFSMTVTNHLKTLYSVWHIYGGPKWVTERSERYWGKHMEPFSADYLAVFRNIVRDFGEHRIAPDFDHYLGYLADSDRLALHKRYGMDPVFGGGYNTINNFIGTNSPAAPISAETRAANINGLKATASKYRNAGVANLAVLKIADEPTEAYMPIVRIVAQDTQTAMPDIQRFLTVTASRLPDSLIGLVDTWCPLWGAFDFESPQAQARKAAGDRFWAYGAEYKSNVAYEPMDLRMPYWLYWKYGITGIHYSHHDHSCFLTYPNDTYPHSDGFVSIPSIRWEMIRHGVQDYEYLWLLNDLVQKSGKRGDRYRELLAVPADLATNDTDYTSDPRLLLQQRDRIARAIEDLSR